MIDILRLCIARGDEQFLYEIAKIIAESDSVGEGYSYCERYSRERFEEEQKKIMDGKEGMYVPPALDIYSLHLNKIT